MTRIESQRHNKKIVKCYRAFIRGPCEIHIYASQKSEPIDSVLSCDSVFSVVFFFTGVMLENVGFLR
jgi:hypothetical protein